MLAAALGDTETIQLLLQYGAKVGITMSCEGGADEDGRMIIISPLLIACEYGQVAALRLLLEHGADANKQFKFCHNNTILMYLFRYGRWVIQQYYTGQTHRHEPDRSQDMQNCLKLLLQYGADVTLTNDQGESVYDYVRDPVIHQIFAEHSAEAKPSLE